MAKTKVTKEAKPKNKKGHARSASQEARDKKLIAGLYLKGKIQVEIAELVNVSQATVSRTLKALQADWLKDAVSDLDKAKAKELARLDLAEMELWEAWERSKQEAQVQTSKTKTGAAGTQGNQAEASLRRETQCGNSAYMLAIIRVVEKRCELRGMDAPKVEQLMGEITMHVKREEVERRKPAPRAKRKINA